MNQDIETLKSTTFCGKRFTRKQLVQIQETIKTFPNLSRRELSRTICENLRWITPNGSYKIQYCLSALKEMEKVGIIRLPPIVIEKQRKAPQKKIIWTVRTEEQPNIRCSLDELGSISIQKVTEKDDIECWNEFVDRHHYLGYRRPIGTYLRYYIVSKKQNENKILGCLLFSFAVWSLPCRDKWIGWTDKVRTKRLHLILNNNRFLIFPWVNVKFLASKVLSLIYRQIGDDWEKHHGYRPVLLETFIDPSKYKGTCYRAANWQYIGKTSDRKSTNGLKGDVSQKDFYVYPLVPDFQSVLKNEKKLSRTQPRKKTDNPASDDPFILLWQKIVTLVQETADDFDQKWQKRKRVINTMLLILFIFRIVFSKNKQGYGTTISELWEQCHRMNLILPQRKPVAPSAFCNARTKLHENIFKILNSKIINTYETNWRGSEWYGHRIFVVDGTKINLPRQLRSYGYTTPSENAYYPQGLASCLYQLKSNIPYDFDLVTHQDERKVALSHLQTLKQDDVVVYDRGYFSYAMLYYHVNQGIHTIFRMKKNANKVVDEFIRSDDSDKVVIIEISENNQKDIVAKNPDIKFIPIKLRLIKYAISGKTYTLGTTLIDSNNYKVDKFPEIYHSRWGVEELYKISKILIDIEEFHGQTERGIKQELFAHFVLITINRIFASQTEAGFTIKESSSSQINKTDTLPSFKVNFKNCLITIARNLEGLFIQQAKLVKRTINRIISSISLVRQKERPNRSYQRKSMKPVKKWRPSKEKKTIAPVLS